MDDHAATFTVPRDAYREVVVERDDARAEVKRLRFALADLLRNAGCMCDHPLVTGACAKRRAMRAIDA